MTHASLNSATRPGRSPHGNDIVGRVVGLDAFSRPSTYPGAQTDHARFAGSSSWRLAVLVARTERPARQTAGRSLGTGMSRGRPSSENVRREIPATFGRACLCLSPVTIGRPRGRCPGEPSLVRSSASNALHRPARPTVVSVASSAIWDWRLYILDEDQRVELMANYEKPLRPDLAMELWRQTALHVLEPTVWTVTNERVRWRLPHRSRTSWQTATTSTVTQT